MSEELPISLPLTAEGITSANAKLVYAVGQKRVAEYAKSMSKTGRKMAFKRCEEAGFISIKKHGRGRNQLTIVELTPKGRAFYSLILNGFKETNGH